MKNPLFDENKTTQRNRTANVLGRYFKNIQSGLASNGKALDFLLGNAGVPILLYLLEPIIAHIGKIPSSSDLRPYTDLICDYFGNMSDEEISTMKKTATGEGGRRLYAQYVGKRIKTIYRDFWQRMEASDLEDRIKDIERSIADLISKKLAEKHGDDWFKGGRGIPQEIFLAHRHQFEKEKCEFKDYLDLGEEKQIICSEKNWPEVFRSIFVVKGWFRDKNEVGVAFDNLSSVRAPYAHGAASRALQTPRADLQLAEGYLDKFEYCIKLFTKQIPSEKDEEKQSA